MTTDAQTARIGRIKGALSAEAQKIYYGTPDDSADRESLRLISRVDRAHLVMLSEQNIIPADKAATLLQAVTAVEDEEYADVLSRPRPRGLYLAYEQAIVERCGPDIGGLLHTGRSRNDLNATTNLLTLRQLGLDLMDAGLGLVDSLLTTGEEQLDLLMPIHTHYQPAMPITLGYYLTGVAMAVGRQLERFLHSLESIRSCPLGAHAVAGTDLPLDTARTASLLGFDTGPVHAVDSIASRDVALEMMAQSAVLATTVSRLATDLQLWSMSELGYIAFPDSLVGSSSAMPQKRNAFLLEYLKGRPSTVIGAWVTAMTATKTSPFSNSIEAGTEAMAPLSSALRTTEDVLALARLVVSGLQPRPDSAASAAAGGLVEATAMANELVRQGVPFREAHDQVGASVLAYLECSGCWPPEGLDHVDIGAAVGQARYGGGPGAKADALVHGFELLHQIGDRMQLLRGSLVDSDQRLNSAVAGF